MTNGVENNTASFASINKTQMTMLAITVGFMVASTVALAQGTRKSPSTKALMTIDAPIDSVFDYIVPIDLTHIFKRYKNLPAITSTSIKEG
jgi:hypothetical protein